ncbi:MAG TPA: ATP-binding protein [Kofleriaceae bacterium]|nr:ATP-binding protein [Kofleriaceae bacterium]
MIPDSDRRFSALWRSGMVGLVVGDRHGVIHEANDTYLRLVGYGRADVEAGSLRYTDLTPPELRGELAEVLARIGRDGFAEPFETETFRADGSRLPILVGVTRLDADRSLAIITDLSARRRAEESLRHTEEQLRHAQKMEAVGRLAGGVAHDFNNLLSIIIAYPSLILAGLEAQDPMRDDLEEILRAGNRAAELTRRLLLFSRQQVVEPRVIDLNQVLAGMTRMVQRLLGEDIELHASLAGDLGLVLIDPGNLEHVVMNLVVNSRDAMPTGGSLTVQTANVELDADYAARHVGATPGAYVMLAITDSGCGMDAATLAHIFEPFFTTKAVGQGTGLGLSTVFGIVQQSGGHVWVYSEPGHGTTFRIYLPRVDGAVHEVGIAAAGADLRGHETVLLAEDEDQVRAVAVTILHHYGYKVLEARNAGEALLLCEQHPGTIDLLLSDVVMPGMSGPELARRLRASRPEMRVLCMSGYTDDAVVRHGLVDKTLAFLPKPLTPETLGRKLREVLR